MVNERGAAAAVDTARGAAAAVGADPFAAYLPRLVVDWIASTPERRHRAVEGTVAFVDVSGFTKLSEALARRGRIGAEELASTIGACFSPLLDVAYENGGRLLKFGGDALLLQFTGSEHEARACRAVFEMREVLREVGRLTVLAQHVTLRMSVGVHSGMFDMFLVGGSHRELVVTGPAATTTIAMESAASPGDILLSERTAAALSPSDLGRPQSGGRLLRRAPRVAAGASTAHDPVAGGLDLGRCIPVAIRRALSDVSREPEHRVVTIAFVHFEGTDAMLASAGPDAVGDELERLVADAQAAADRLGVTFLGTDIDTDGGKIILVAGAPSTSGNDELPLLLAVRELADSKRGLTVRIGVNRGAVFAGDIGPHYRRTFTIMGDAVNLAARVMSKAAPGEILATPDVLARSHSEFAVTAVDPFTVKGKSRPVEAVSVGAHRGRRAGDAGTRLPLVGRSGHLGQWRTLLGDAERGAGAVVEITGEPGVGKSRLLEELLSVATHARTMTVTCEQYDSATPYGAVRSLVRGIVGIGDGSRFPAGPDGLRAALASAAPELVPWAPLVGAVVDVELPETPETAELEPEFRSARLGETMAELFSRLLPGLTIVAVEDAHAMDEASATLVRRVAAAAADHPWLFVFTRRDVASGFVATPGAVTRIELAPLAGTDAATLVEIATGGEPLSPHETAALAERSGGNPLFLQELVAAARAGGSIESLPDSVEAVIAARLDRLDPGDRHLVRRASVLGRSAPWHLLAAVLEEVPTRSDPTWSRVREFLAPDADGRLVFRHALVRDGAYDGLSYRLRRELHARVADAIALAADDRPEDHAELLSLHYFHAQRHEEARAYSLIAARRAEAVYANLEAAELYERTLAASRDRAGHRPAELAAVHESLGDARHRAGDYHAAVAAYAAARRLVRDDRLAQARLMMKLSRAQGWLDRYSNALRWITRALRLLDGDDGEEAGRQRAQLLAWYGRFCQEQGHHARAISWCRRAVEAAERSGEKNALANALGVLDWAHMDLGTLEEPANWRRGLALSEEIGDLQGQATMLNSLGMFAYFRGRWDEALELYARAKDTARRAGNAVQLAFYENNIAEIALDQGRIDEAERLFVSVSRTWRAAGYRSGAAYVQCNLARVATRRGRFAEAAELFEASQREADALGSLADSLEAGARWAECELLSGQVTDALRRADAELARARELGGAPQLPLLLRVRGAALARSGDLTAGRVALGQSVERALERHVDFEVALSTRTAARLAGLGEPSLAPDLAPASTACAADADRILEALGVVDVADLLADAPGPSPLRKSARDAAATWTAAAESLDA